MGSRITPGQTKRRHERAVELIGSALHRPQCVVIGIEKLFG